MAQRQFLMDGGFNAKSASTISADLFINGALVVSGTTTTTNTVTLDVENNKITLNSTEVGTPSLNASLEVERGTDVNTSIRWNETTDQWELTNDGVTFNKISTSTYNDTLAITAVGDAGYALETYVDNALFQKADMSYVQTYYYTKEAVDGSLAIKADASAVNASIADLQTVQATKASTTYVDNAISNLVNGADAAFDTLLEIQNAMATDTELATAIAGLNIPTATSDITNDSGYVALSNGFTVTENGASAIEISYGGTKLFSLDNLGNLTVIGNITGYGTIA